VGRSRTWWLVALVIQFWHHIEHGLLQVQAITGHNLFGAAVPTSIAQLVIPRLELHLLYNTLVFVPMVVAMLYHLFPSAPEAAACGAVARCIRRKRKSVKKQSVEKETLRLSLDAFLLTSFS
jgi:hypothetical protein